MPVAYRFTLTLPAGMEKAAGDLGFKEVTTVTRRVLNRATVLTPVDTGRLRASLQMRVRRVGSSTTGEVFTTTAYAGAVHDGTKRATVIVPTRRKALRFVVDGKVVFAKRVVLPPRKGRPFLLRAVKEVAAQRGYRLVTR
jgi:hypothetical protein